MVQGFNLRKGYYASANQGNFNLQTIFFTDSYKLTMTFETKAYLFVQVTPGPI